MKKRDTSYPKDWAAALGSQLQKVIRKLAKVEQRLDALIEARSSDRRSSR